MFSEEFNGYKKVEVQNFINRMKASYEAKLMEEKLKVLDAEKKVLDITNERIKLENKEKNIMNTLNIIEKAQQFQEEGSKNIFKLIKGKLEILIQEMEIKFPMLKQDLNFAKELNEFKKILNSLENNQNQINVNNPINSENDSMRILLNRMQEYKKTNSPTAPKELHITTNKPSQTIPDGESGFSFEEALNPTEDLEDIMKAFDFYNDWYV